LGLKFSETIKLLLIVLALGIICIPTALIITVLSNPLVLWIEKTFSIESVGHSGPAEWCYIAVYLLLISVSGLILLKIRNQKQNKA